MKTTHLKRSLLVLTNLVFILSLAYGQKSGSGTLVEQNRSVAPFTKIEAGSAFTISLKQGTETKVLVETDDNFQDRIETVVENGRLTISSLGMQNPSAMKVKITTPSIDEINIYGAARFSSEGIINSPELKLELSGASKADIEINAEILNSEISGASKVTIKGVTLKHNADVSGAVSLNALELTATSTVIDLSGASKATINSTNEIKAELSGASVLSYYDNGKLNKLSKQGSFEITPENPSNEITQTPKDQDISTIYEDSTIVRIGDVSVEVHDGNSTKVTIGGNELEVDDEGNVKFKKSGKKTRYDGHWGGLELGINGYVNNQGEFDMPENYEFLDLRMNKSINVKINFYEQNFNLIANHLGLTTGLGFEWNNYRFDNNVVLVKEGNDLIDAYDFNPANYTKSKLVVNYLNLPIMFEYQTNRFSKKNSFHLGAGIQTGLRIGSHTKRVFQDDGRKKKDKDPGDYNLNPFKYDAMVRIGWGKINLHANYSLNTLFKNNQGPELYPFTVGISLVSW
ncbi:MAG: DUF2807 domain-containing protein [Lentimicrobium sp.]|jgi:hypothetical protein|nr:DUF2807 domain-containing protein [Lentimicrobium sp.]